MQAHYLVASRHDMSSLLHFSFWVRGQRKLYACRASPVNVAACCVSQRPLEQARPNNTEIDEISSAYFHDLPDCPKALGNETAPSACHCTSRPNPSAVSPNQPQHTKIRSSPDPRSSIMYYNTKNVNVAFWMIGYLSIAAFRLTWH